MVELDDGACGHLPHTALPSKLTSPLASALHFQTYFSSRWSTSLPNLLLLSLQHVTSKLTSPLAAARHFQTYWLLLSLQHFTSKLTSWLLLLQHCTSKLTSPLTSALHIQTYFYLARCSTSLLPNLLQISVRSSLLLRRCTALHSTLPPPLTLTLSHTHTHIACTLSFNDRTRRSSRMVVSGESQSKCTHRLPVYLLNLSLTQAALHLRTYFSSHFDTQPHTHSHTATHTHSMHALVQRQNKTNC